MANSSLGNKIIGLSLLAASGMVPAVAQAAPGGGGGGGGCVDASITIAVVSAIDFGQILCASGAGTVSIAALDGSYSSSAGCVVLSGTPVRAQFTVNGNQQQGAPGSIEVTIPPTAVINFNGNSMSVTGLHMEPGGGTYHSFANAKLKQTYLVGGTLNVSGTQPGGTYTGSFTVNAQCL